MNHNAPDCSFHSPVTGELSRCVGHYETLSGFPSRVLTSRESTDDVQPAEKSGTGEQDGGLVAGSARGVQQHRRFRSFGTFTGSRLSQNRRRIRERKYHPVKKNKKKRAVYSHELHFNVNNNKQIQEAECRRCDYFNVSHVFTDQTLSVFLFTRYVYISFLSF